MHQQVFQRHHAVEVQAALRVRQPGPAANVGPAEAHVGGLDGLALGGLLHMADHGTEDAPGLRRQLVERRPRTPIGAEWRARVEPATRCAARLTNLIGMAALQLSGSTYSTLRS